MVEPGPGAWIGTPGCCNVFFVGAMWIERVAGFTDAFVAGMNKAVSATGACELAIGMNAAQEATAVQVTGKYGRQHLSPRLTVSWEAATAFTQGWGGGKMRYFYTRTLGPPNTPWAILTRNSLSEDWRAITPVFDPRELTCYSSRQGWSWCTC